MVIRKLKKRKLSVKGFLIILGLCIIAVLAILKVLRMQNDNMEISNIDIPEIPNYAIGDPITVSGEIYAENNFPHYTHIVADQKDQSFGLKSSILNLNNFAANSGDIEVAGHIASIFKSIPVIEVDSIKLPSQSLVINQESYLFTEDLLRFDFGKQVGFNAKKIDNTIHVYFNATELLSYERFVCNKVVKSQNCEEIVGGLRKSRAENFISYDGYTYYRYGSGKWITFNDNIFAYVITTSSDERLLDLSAATKIIDKSFVVKNKENIIKTQCQSGDEKFLNIDNYQYKQLNSREIQIDAFGATNQNYKNKCEVKFDLWDKWNSTEVTLIHLEK